MKIQFFRGNTFSIEGKDAKMVFDPEKDFSNSVDFVTNSGQADVSGIKESKKILTLPGEFEISDILVNGYYSNGLKNVIFKISVDDVSFAHFGNLEDVPETKVFDKLGEDIDVVIVSLSEKFNEKKAKELIEQIDPRMVLLGGDQTLFPKMVESMGAKTAEENPMKLVRSQLSEEKTEVLILPV